MAARVKGVVTLAAWMGGSRAPPGALARPCSHDPGKHCTIIKFVLEGRFKESELFPEYKKRIGV